MCWLDSAPCAHTPAVLIKRFLVLHTYARECEHVMLTSGNAADESCLYHSSTCWQHQCDFSSLPQGEMGWEESSMSFFICKVKFLYHLYRKRTQVSQIGANCNTVARAFDQLKREGGKGFLNMTLPLASSFQHLFLALTQWHIVMRTGEKHSRKEKGYKIR